MTGEDRREAKGRPLALKPYLEGLQSLCGRLSKEELTRILVGLAAEAPAQQRAPQLERIERLSRSVPPARWDDGLLPQIEQLKTAIKRRVASIRDGSYFERELVEYVPREYEEETPETLTQEQLEKLEAFFDDASQLFLSGELAGAREVYSALFALMDEPIEEEDPWPCLSDRALEIDVREARARYARCVYETIPLRQRAKALLAVMKLDARLSDVRFDVYENPYPMFTDLMDARPLVSHRRSLRAAAHPRATG